ncbi:MAG: hypothetical protein ACREDF_09955, partial [Thermoplasmata archaeon]
MAHDDRPLPMNRDLGDMWSRLEERHQGYWDINRRSVPMIGPTPVVGPTCPPTRTPPSMQCEPPPGFPPTVWEWLRDRAFSALHEVLQTFKEDLKCGTYFVKNPSWIEPPITTIRLDRKVNLNTPVSLAPVGPAGAFTDVLTIRVPDLTVGTIWAIAPNPCTGLGLSKVQWEELINGAPITDGLYVYNKAPGDHLNRDTEPVPIFLPPLSTFVLRARNIAVAGPAEDVMPRITGQLLPVKDIS